MATPVLSPTPVEEWRDIVDAIDALVPSGSTNMEAGLLLGYEQARESFDPDDINVVVLASDGVANQGVTDPEVLTDQITQSGDEGIHLVTVGYGMGNYNDHLMEQLADQGDGFYSYVDTFAEAVRLFVDELTPTLYVVAEEAKVQVVFDPDVVAAYRLIGYENRMLDDEEFTDDSVDAGELGAGHQVSALYEIELVDGAGTGDVAGEVRLRWQEPGTDDVTELDQPIEIGGEPSDAIRMAALVGYTAELLKGNQVVDDRDVTLEDLLDDAEDLADEDVDGADVMEDLLEDALDAEPPYPTETVED
jgi:Ca-activated chloride channel family protein